MKKLATFLLVAFGYIHSVQAVLLTEVADNAYITVGGYDIAWAAPCSPLAPTCGALDLSYQAQFGWGIITRDLYDQLGITAQDFVFDGANVEWLTGNNLDEASGARVAALANPLPTGDVAVAAPWFSTRHDHIDWVNGLQGFCGLNANGTEFCDGGSNDTLVYRTSSVPAPAPALLLLFGLFLITRYRRA